MGFARTLSTSPPELLLSAGGDGTAVALINALRHTLESAPEVARLRTPVPGSDTMARPLALGVLPLGTGNGWARATGAPAWRSGLRRLGIAAKGTERLPSRRFDLVEVCGTVAHFAGTGWDAEIIDDFHAQQEGFGVLPKRMRNGLAGYLQGLFLRTIPRHVFGRKIEVEVVNTGADAMTVDEQGRAIPLRGGEHGKVLYQGPASVCAAATSREWGFGFRAFPFAGLVPRRLCFRIYAAHALEATMRMGRLWRGEHPVPKMHTFLVTECRATFSQPVPFQVGGDRLGHKQQVDYRLADEQIDVLDWTRLLRPANTRL